MTAPRSPQKGFDQADMERSSRFVLPARLHIYILDFLAATPEKTSATAVCRTWEEILLVRCFDYYFRGSSPSSKNCITSNNLKRACETGNSRFLKIVSLLLRHRWLELIEVSRAVKGRASTWSESPLLDGKETPR